MDLIIKKGTELYHATGEEFSPEELHGGGYDKIVWTTTDSAISQTYIPHAGIRAHVSSSAFIKPAKNDYITDMQKAMGIEFSEVDWQGNTPTSYRITKSPFKQYEFNDQKPWYEIEKERLAKVNELIEKIYHYTPKDENPNNNSSWELKIQHGKVMPGDFRMKGRLIILVPNQDLKVFDMTSGETIDGDLTDVDYNKLGMFEKIQAAGYDGVKINDYAQSRDMGNFGHTSIGLFPQGLKKVHQEIVPDVQHPDIHPHYIKGDYRSQEYMKHRGINEVRRLIRNILRENLG